MEKYLTPEGLEKFKKELAELKNVKRKEIAQRIKYAASFGDLSENFSYQQAKDDQGFLERRILELEKIISQAKVIERGDGKKVQIGSVVTVSINNKKQKIQIVEPEEVSFQESKISFKSPLGEALMGKSAGKIINVQTPAGKMQYKIIEIR